MRLRSFRARVWLVRLDSWLRVQVLAAIPLAYTAVAHNDPEIDCEPTVVAAQELTLIVAMIGDRLPLSLLASRAEEVERWH